MGLSPRQVGELSLAEYRCMVDAHNTKSGVKPKADAPSAEEHAARIARLKDR